MSGRLETILDKAARGDQAAWRHIVEAYTPRVFGLIRARCHDVELTEELTQSVFCTVAAKLTRPTDGARANDGDSDDKGEGASGEPSEGGFGYVEQGKFEAWLFRIAINRLRDEMRRRKRHAVSMEGEHLDVLGSRTPSGDQAGGQVGDHENRPVRDEALADMRDAIASLPDADREIIELRHLAGLSFRQIADMLDQPLGTVLARQHRALKKLKHMLAQHAGEMETR